MSGTEASSTALANNVTRFDTNAGRSIYRLTVEVFPGFHGNAYLIDDGDRPILVDCGSGQPRCNRDLDRCMAELASLGPKVSYADLQVVLLSHGHIDHFGGLTHLRQFTDAPVMVHPLDRPIVTRYEERLQVSSRKIDRFFADAGVERARRGRYLELYLSMKRLFTSVEVGESIEPGPILEGALEAIATPGHCPGHVCLRVDDVLLTGDQLLAEISPNIWPESITQNTGLLHYFDSLDRVAALPGVRLGLGGHGGQIDDISGRCASNLAEHRSRLEQILELCAEPRTLVELSKALFGSVRSYHILLAVLETGALVEYLELHGELRLANAAELENDAEQRQSAASRAVPPALLYERI